MTTEQDAVARNALGDALDRVAANFGWSSVETRNALLDEALRWLNGWHLTRDTADAEGLREALRQAREALDVATEHAEWHEPPDWVKQARRAMFAADRALATASQPD